MANLFLKLGFFYYCFGFCSLANFLCPKKPAQLMFYDKATHLYLNTSRKNIVIKNFLTLFTVFRVVWAAFAVSFTLRVAVTLSSSFKDFKATSSAGECCRRQNKTVNIFG